MMEDDKPWTTLTEEVFLTAKQQEWANEAREQHPSDKTKSTALNNGNLVHTRLTCQHIRNAKPRLGPCSPCIQEKIKVPSDKSSESPPDD